MKQEDIIRMAREVDLIDHELIDPVNQSATYIWQLQSFAVLVEEAATEAANARANISWSLMCKKMVAAENEACAKVCESMRTYVDRHNAVIQSSATDCAAAIRARGNT